MNQKEFVDNIQEKFIKCSNCDHYSFDSAQGSTLERLISFFFPSTVYICLNCKKKHIILKNGPSRNTKLILSIIPVLIGGYLLFINIDFKKIFNPPPTQITAPDKKEQKESAKSEVEQPLEKPETEGATTDTVSNSEDKKETTTSDENRPADTEQKQIDQTEEKPVNEPVTEADKPAETPVDTTEQLKEEQKTDKISGTIILNRRKYGVNWKQIESGIIITKMSPGPFMRAGMKIGDVITHVDGEPVGAGQKLMALRNRVFSGEIKDVTLSVIRKGEEMTYLMVGKSSSDKL